MTDESIVVDRIEVFHSLIHPTVEEVDTEIMECLLDSGYDSFVGICNYIKEMHLHPTDISCIVCESKPAFVLKDDGGIIDIYGGNRNGKEE